MCPFRRAVARARQRGSVPHRFQWWHKWLIYMSSPKCCQCSSENSRHQCLLLIPLTMAGMRRHSMAGPHQASVALLAGFCHWADSRIPPWMLKAATVMSPCQTDRLLRAPRSGPIPQEYRSRVKLSLKLQRTPTGGTVLTCFISPAATFLSSQSSCW